MMRLQQTILGMLLATILIAAHQAQALPVRTFRSQYYLIHTDLDAGVAQDLARRMDAMHVVYGGRFPGDNAGPPSQVYLFAKRADYLSFTGRHLRSTGGVFLPGKNVLAAFLETQGRDALRRTLQHEAFHQFAYLSISDRLPIWLNEGMAQYYEEGLWVDGHFWLGQVPPRRLRQLQADIKARRLVPFGDFMAMSPDDWARALKSHGETRGATQYNQAWAMVHFLVTAADPTGKPLYRERLSRMFELIRAGTDSKTAFETAFSANYEGFQAKFLAFVASLRPSPEATYIERQEVLGDMLIALDEHAKPVKDVLSFRQTVRQVNVHIQYSRGQIKWATEKDTSVYFSNLAGRLFDANELYFSARRSAPLPEIVCRFSPASQLRTRFYAAGKEIEHETSIEAIPTSTGARRAQGQ